VAKLSLTKQTSSSSEDDTYTITSQKLSLPLNPKKVIKVGARVENSAEPSAEIPKRKPGRPHINNGEKLETED
jgi:hypothetical protein